MTVFSFLMKCICSNLVNRASIPYVIKTIPETSITGNFIKDEIEESLNTFGNS